MKSRETEDGSWAIIPRHMDRSAERASSFWTDARIQDSNVPASAASHCVPGVEQLTDATSRVIASPAASSCAQASSSNARSSSSGVENEATPFSE